MKKTKVISLILTLIIPIIGYYYLKIEYINLYNILNIENVVGIVAILSGITGIIMGIGSMRQASLDAIKDYFQQGDNPEHVKAREFISKNKNNLDEDSVEVKKIVNFYQLWGILNRKRYLPLWVFSGASGIRVVELYINIEKIIIKKRQINPYYGQEFEWLSYRIYRKYKKNFLNAYLVNEYTDCWCEFCRNANKR